MSSKHLSCASLLALAASLCAGAGQARADTQPAEPVSGGTTTSQLVVTGQRTIADINQLPETVEGVGADVVQLTTNVSTVEDELKYLPDVLIRQRHIGDTQAPITTRTSGVGSPARSLVYEDGVLVSALIGNNNTNASPRWDLISPDEVAHTDIFYGPFSAAFPGNSIGEVVQITTRMPEHLEASLTTEGAWQFFNLYGTDKTFPTGRISGTVGDRIGRFSFWVSAFHLDTESQPLLYVTSATPAAPSTTGTPVTGAYLTQNRTNVPIALIGAGGLEHQTIDNATLKLAYDFTPSITGTYSLGFYRNYDRAGVQSYLQTASGAPAFAGALNIGGYAYTIANSAFSNDLYHLEEDHLAQSLTLGSHSGGTFDWELIASDYAYVKDAQRTPSTALPGAFAGGAGTITSLGGTGWYTLDAKGYWRPQGPMGANQVSFGLHEDRFKLDSPKFNVADWIGGEPVSTASLARGDTKADAAWAQDLITLTPQVNLTVGGRYEHWSAYHGVNVSLSPALNVSQPALKADAFSPKAVLAYSPTEPWRFTASVGKAYRFPTVEELYQSVTTGALLSVPNPNLKPEDDVSVELAAERSWKGFERSARLRLSLFGENISNALLSQSAPLVPGSSTLYSYVQNINETHARGVELVGQESGFLIKQLDVSGWVTYVDGKTVADSAYPTAVGKHLPQLPPWRGSLVETYRATATFALTVAERYSDRAFGTIDNTDHFANTFTGFSAYFVTDVHAQYIFSPHITGDIGIDNLNDRKYFLYHPFPQRTVVAQLKFQL